MNEHAVVSIPTRLSARELRRLPANVRETLLKAAATSAELDYRSNPELTACEAFGKDDLHGDNAHTETR